jgi:hypothetical protein
MRTPVEHAISKPRPLRGKVLVNAALEVLAKWASLSPKSHPINMSRLAHELGITRQALYDNGLKPILFEHKDLQAQRFSDAQEAVVQRRSLEERLAAQKEEILKLHRIIDSWIERWATVEYNAKMVGIDADKLFAPLPPPSRSLGHHSRLKNNGDNEE